MTINVVTGDITQQRVDAIVNAANERLLGGSGVDGAIHRAAGPQLLEACRAIGGCPTGQARITPGFDLPARFVIHTVGPVWRGGYDGESHALASCYRSVFALAQEHDIRSLAFPSISTGAYRFPVKEAARIAVETINAQWAITPGVDTVHVVCFDAKTEIAYRDALSEVDA